MSTFNPSTEQEQQKQMVELLPSVNLPMGKTLHISSRAPLHHFKLNDLVWGSRMILQCVERLETKPKTSTKPTPVSKPCIKTKRCKRQSFSKQVNKVLEGVRERSARRREGLFSFSLRREEIDQDFIRVTGSVPQRKIKVKKTFTDPDEEDEYIDYQKFLKALVPGNWLSEIYRV